MQYGSIKLFIRFFEIFILVIRVIIILVIPDFYVLIDGGTVYRTETTVIVGADLSVIHCLSKNSPRNSQLRACFKKVSLSGQILPVVNCFEIFTSIQLSKCEQTLTLLEYNFEKKLPPAEIIFQFNLCD